MWASSSAHPPAREMSLAEPHLQPKLDLGKSTWPFRSQIPAYNVVLLSVRHRDSEKAKAFYLKHGAPANKTD